MEKPISIKNNPDNVIIIVACIVILFFCASIFFLSLYQTSITNNETKIIKIKYMNLHAVIDECNHPHMIVPNMFPFPDLNVSDVYEITVASHRNDYASSITNFKLVDEEKYIKNCSVI